MTAEEQVVKTLIERKMKISFAESCTGGMCCERLVGVENTSNVLDASFITYANEAKVKYLGVKASTIECFGVVSEEVAAEMARGVAKETNADVGVGITGIAGPGGATKNKPVGMVCFGFYVKGSVQTVTMQFGDIGREKVRKSSADFVFETLNKIL